MEKDRMRYNKEFLVSAFLSRYYSLDTSNFEALEKMAESFYDKAGKDKFRTYCSLDAEAIKVYKEKFWLDRDSVLRYNNKSNGKYDTEAQGASC